jgi:hypothetical protein
MIEYKMTSVLSYKSQIPPFTYYIVENNGGYMLNSLVANGESPDIIELSGNTVLADMGKTVVIHGYIYRKVQIHSVDGVVIPDLPTGFICLNSDSAPLFDGTNQGVRKLN